MKQLLLLFFMLPFLANAQTGIISGNAYWKYNDYVGNKADVGSVVNVYSDSDSAEMLSTQCDLQGNFKLDNVKPGRYLVAVFSKNTNTNGTFNWDKLFVTNTSRYLGFDVKSLNPALYDSLLIYEKLAFDKKFHYDSVMIYGTNANDTLLKKMNVWNSGKVLRNYERQKAEREKLINVALKDKEEQEMIYCNAIRRLLIQAPFNKKTKDFSFFDPLPHKYYLREIEVKANQTTTVIADFGITFL